MERRFWKCGFLVKVKKGSSIDLALCLLRPFPRPSSTLVCCIVVVPVWMNEVVLMLYCLQSMDWVCPQDDQTICNVSFIPREQNGCVYLLLTWCILFRRVSDNFISGNLEKGIYDFKQTENRDGLSWPTPWQTWIEPWLMVDPSSQIFICQGKQVLPLPFSFVLLPLLYCFGCPFLGTVKMHCRW